MPNYEHNNCYPEIQAVVRTDGYTSRKLPKVRQLNAVMNSLDLKVQQLAFVDRPASDSIIPLDLLSVCQSFTEEKTLLEPIPEPFFTAPDVPAEARHYYALASNQDWEAVEKLDQQYNSQLAHRYDIGNSTRMKSNISHWRDARYILTNGTPRLLAKVYERLDSIIMNKIKDHAFYLRRTEPKLREEVDLRRNQFPGDDIYGFIGRATAEYIQSFSGPSFLGVKWIQLNQNQGWGYSGEGDNRGQKCDPWASAIVAKSQIGWQVVFNTAWNTIRGNRHWIIQELMAIKAACLVAAPIASPEPILIETTEMDDRLNLIDLD